jgi:hypothetical protein
MEGSSAGPVMDGKRRCKVFEFGDVYLPAKGQTSYIQEMMAKFDTV